MADYIRVEYAVYLLPRSSAATPELSAVLHDVIKRFPSFTPVDELPAKPQSMLVHAYVQSDVKRKYAPPTLKLLGHSGHGISRIEAEALQNSNRALILDFGHPKRDVWTALRAAEIVAEELARKTGGLLWDEETREVFSPDAWHQKRAESWTNEVPDVSNEMVIHTYPKDDSVRAVSLGMSKMGLPDVTIETTGWSSDNQVANLINIFSQSLAEGGSTNGTGDFKLDLHAIKNARVRAHLLGSLKANAAAVACLSLKNGEWEEGDAKNRLIQVTSDKYSGPDTTSKQEAMFSSFFGSEDSVSQIEHNDELLAASARAKAKLPDLQTAFMAGLQPGEFIEVKAPFATTRGGNEWMWVEVTKWKGDQIEGRLENDPFDVPTLHSGENVTVRQQDVFDYIRQFPDKTSEGNTTGDIIRKMDQENRGMQPTSARIQVPQCGAN